MKFTGRLEDELADLNEGFVTQITSASSIGYVLFSSHFEVFAISNEKD